MNSITSFLDNSIVNNTIRLFLILYAGYLYQVDTTHLHSLLNQQIFSIAFIILVMFALTRKFWFSLILTLTFYAFFHFLKYIENKQTDKLQPIISNSVSSINNLSTIQKPNNIVKNNTNLPPNATNEEDSSDSENESEIAGNKVNSNFPNSEIIETKPESYSWNKMQQFINLQTINSFDKPGDIKFIDVSLKKENILPHNTFEVRMGKF
jgi:hypothetical protein